MSDDAEDLVRMEIRIPARLKQLAEAAAAGEGVSLSDLVRELLARRVKQPKLAKSVRGAHRPKKLEG